MTINQVPGGPPAALLARSGTTGRKGTIAMMGNGWAAVTTMWLFGLLTLVGVVLLVVVAARVFAGGLTR